MITSTLTPINKRVEFKPIHYGNGYERITYTFDHPVGKIEFKEFCIANNMKLSPKPEEATWFEDSYDIVSRNNNTEWIYTHVLAYTD